MKKVCVFTGTRAEYGLLLPLIKEIKADKALKLQTIVSGMHFCDKYGNTYKEILKDGIKIDAKVKMFFRSNDSLGVATDMGVALKGISSALQQLKPDILVVLGDRYETLAAAISAMLNGIAIAHIHGGEVTIGAMDESIRHAITKMAHLHFVSTKEYRKRVIQLGEYPKNVFNVGALGVDNIKNMELLSKKDLERSIGFVLKEKNFLITYHPVTLENNTAKKQFEILLNVLDKQKDTGLIFTKANADMGSEDINKLIDDYSKKNKDKAITFCSMGQLRYLSAMKYVDAVIGNSSSGIIEAPSLRTPTVNIGDRQKGRITTESIISCSNKKQEIEKAIEKALSVKFRKKLISFKNPYGVGKTALKITEKLKTVKLAGILKKEFYNIKEIK